MADTLLPVKHHGHRIGTARVSEDGLILNVEIDREAWGYEFMQFLKVGLADHLSISPGLVPAVQATKENDNNGS